MSGDPGPFDPEHVSAVVAAPIRLHKSATDTMRGRISRAVAAATRGGEPVLAALSVDLDGELDPAALALASRRPKDSWFCFEQPDRDGLALGTLGAVATLDGSGTDRFKVVEKRWQDLVATAECDSADFGAGLVAVGGFAFSPYGGLSAIWRQFDPISMHVPEVALARTGEKTRLTVAVLARPHDDAEEHLHRVRTRLSELRTSEVVASRPSLDCNLNPVYPAQHYKLAVQAAIDQIGKGNLDKVVLARAVDVTAAGQHAIGPVYGALRRRFPSCLVFCVGRGGSAFLAASPELLVRRHGFSVSTVALAGSAPRSDDRGVDEHLGRELLTSDKNLREHEMVERWIERALRPHAIWLVVPPTPSLVRVANVQHLATPLRAHLANPIGVLRLASMLHPTPAVGGEPLDVAEGLIASLEELDRGWYAGGVGWMDANEDGEFFVSLRSALINGRVARCFAGVGVVIGSDPDAELAETETKLNALLPTLAAEGGSRLPARPDEPGNRRGRGSRSHTPRSTPERRQRP